MKYKVGDFVIVTFEKLNINNWDDLPWTPTVFGPDITFIEGVKIRKNDVIDIGNRPCKILNIMEGDVCVIAFRIRSFPPILLKPYPTKMTYETGENKKS